MATQEGEIDNIKYTIEEQPPLFGRGKALKITIPNATFIPSSINCSLRAGLQNSFKNKGRFAHTGDAEFDAKVDFDSDDPNYALSVFQQTERRDIILSLFGNGVSAISFEGDLLSAIIYNIDLSHLEDATLAYVVKNLFQIQQALPRPSLLKSTLKKNILFKSFIRNTIISITLSIVFFIMFLHGYRDIQFIPPIFPLKGGLIITICLFPFFLIIYRAFIRSGKLWDLYHLANFLIALPPLVFLSLILTLVINTKFDHSSGEEHQLLVVNKAISASMGKVLQVESWDQPGAIIAIPVPDQIFEDSEPYNSKLHLVIKPGKLGYPWLAEYGINK